MPRALRSSLSVTSLVSSAAILVSKKILNKKPMWHQLEKELAQKFVCEGTGTRNETEICLRSSAYVSFAVSIWLCDGW